MVQLAHDGDIIYLDGRGSTIQPYGCENNTALSETEILIKMDLSIVGIHERAYLSCGHGFLFKTDDQTSQRNVTLKHLAFVGIGVHLTGRWNVFIFNCNFMRSVSPLTMKGIILNVTVERSTFERNTNCITIGDGRKSHFKILITVNITGSVFKNNVFNRTGMITLNSSRGKTHITLLNSLFKENNSTGSSQYAVAVFSKEKTTGSLRIINTSFSSTSGGGIRTEGTLDMYFSKLTFVSNRQALWLVAYSASSGSTYITLEDSVFINNAAALSLELHEVEASEMSVIVKNCLFREGAEQERTQLPTMRFADRRRTRMNVSLDISICNATFDSLVGDALLFSGFQTQSKLQVQIDGSRFVNNENINYFNRTGYIVYMTVAGVGPPPCHSTRMASHVIIRNTSFEGNKAAFGIIYMKNVDNASIFDCNFSGNFFLSGEGTIIHRGEGRGNLTIKGGTFLQPPGVPPQNTSKDLMTRFPSFIFSMNTGHLVIEGSKFIVEHTSPFYALVAAYKEEGIWMDPKTTIQCQRGTLLYLKNLIRKQEIMGYSKTCRRNVATLKVYCDICPPNTYSLQKGHSVGLSDKKQRKCQLCPYGATCLRGIKAKANHWGYTVNSVNLTFIPCPMGYCLPPNSSNLTIYNGCYGKRAGILCGNCTEDHSEELFGTRCRHDESCHDHLFWVFTAAYSVAFVLFLAFRGPLLSFFWRQIFWFRKDSESQTAHFDDGYLKIVFYFYQVVELLLINDSEFLLSKLIPPLSAWFDLFNFQLRYFSERIGCPFPGLTPVRKELFLCLRVFTTMISCAVVFFIHKGITKIGGWRGPSLALYLAVLLEILLLGYERLADTALSLLHCVPIGSEQRLFLDGNVNCWQWWQFALLGYIIVFVAPFIIVLYLGSRSLYRKSLSVKEFLGACALPLPFLVRWVVQHIRGTRSQEDVHNPNGEEIKKVLYEPFRATKEGDPGAVYWESVLTGRRFVLVCLHSFIASPVYRLMCLEGACVLILVHHVIKRPYHSTRANVFEGLSLIALVAIATFNLTEQAFMFSGVEAELGLQIMDKVETLLLGIVPACVFLFGMFGLLSQLGRFVYLVIKRLKNRYGIRRIDFSNPGQRDPLLGPSSARFT